MIGGVQGQWFRAGAEAERIVREHEARFHEVAEKVLDATGLRDVKHGEILLYGSKFHGYRPITGEPMPAGFRMSRTRGENGYAVLALRTEAGVRINAAVRALLYPSAEDLTKALCGEPWCFVKAWSNPTSASLHSYTFSSERHSELGLLILGVVGGRAPVGCTAIVDADLPQHMRRL